MSPRRLVYSLVPPAMPIGAGSAGPGSDATGSIDGRWQGRIQLPGAPLPVAVTFTQEGGVHTGTFDVPAQGLAGVPLSDVTVNGTSVGFAVPGIPGNPRFQGEFGGTIDGQFTQGGQSFPMSLTRGDLVPPARPQEPKPPFPYRTDDVTYQAGVSIAGTLSRPEGDGPFPAVLLVTGSGAQDRDETIAGHKPFLLLADTLTRAGYAVLRVDDRGVGGTGGVLADAGYDDLAADVAVGLRYLRSRPDIRPDAVGVLGHSEGGYLGPLVAETAQAQPDFVVLMAGPATSGKDVLIEQNERIMKAAGAPQEQIDEQVDFVTAYSDLVISGDFAAATDLVNAQIAKAGGTADQGSSQLASRIGRSLLSYDPAPALRALSVPVLAVFGGRDLQVPPTTNEPAMRQLLSGNPDATVRTFPELNHLMQPATTGLPAEYAAIETTIDPSVLDTFVDWLRERFPPG